MASSLWSRSVKLTPATTVGGYGVSSQAQPLHAGKFCHFSSKRPVAFSSLRVSSTVATAAKTLPAPSPPSDFKASPVPLLLVPQILLDQDEYNLEKNEEPYIFYSLPEKKTVTVQKNQKSWRRDQIGDAHWIGSSKGWIMYINRRDCNLYLCNPFSPTTSPIIPLPPIETLPRVAARHYRRRRSEADENDTTSTELDFEFVLEENWYDPRFFDYEEYPHIEQYDENTKWFEAPLPFHPRVTVPPEDLINKYFIRKISLSSAPPSPANNYQNFRSCIVAIIYGFGEVAICRLGDKRWTYLDCTYSDAIFSRHENLKLFMYNDGYDITSCQVNNTNLSSSELDVIHNFDDYSQGEHYLVESSTKPGHLFDVRISYYCKKINVHRLSLLDGEEKWVRVDSLEDQALFVGDYSEGISVPAAQLPANLKPNCVYFTDFYSCKMGVYNLEDRVMNFHAFDDGICLDLSSFGMRPYGSEESTSEDEGEEHSTGEKYFGQEDHSTGEEVREEHSSTGEKYIGKEDHSTGEDVREEQYSRTGEGEDKREEHSGKEDHSMEEDNGEDEGDEHSSKEDHFTGEDDGEELTSEEAELFWLKQFGMKAEGWAVWVAPNPW